MDSTSIELPGSVISAVDTDGDQLRITFAPAYLVKSMTGSRERTRWHQEGALVFAGVETGADTEMPRFPVECTGGDVGENVYTYRDMIPVPLESRGRAHCVLKFEGGELRVSASAVRLEMAGVPKYIEHLRPEQ